MFVTDVTPAVDPVTAGVRRILIALRRRPIRNERQNTRIL